MSYATIGYVSISLVSIWSLLYVAACISDSKIAAVADALVTTSADTYHNKVGYDYRKKREESRSIRLVPPHATFFSVFGGEEIVVEGGLEEEYLDKWELEYWLERNTFKAGLNSNKENKKKITEEKVDSAKTKTK